MFSSESTSKGEQSADVIEPKETGVRAETLPSKVIIYRFGLPSVAGILTLKLSSIIMDSVSAVAIPWTSARKASMCLAFPLSTLLERNFLFVSRLNVKLDITILLGSLLLWEESETLNSTNAKLISHNVEESRWQLSVDNAVQQIKRELKQSIDRAVRVMRTELTVSIHDLKSVVDGYNDSIKKVEHDLTSRISTLKAEITKANTLSAYNFVTDREMTGSVQHKRIFFNDRCSPTAGKCLPELLDLIWSPVRIDCIKRADVSSKGFYHTCIFLWQIVLWPPTVMVVTVFDVF
uniref:Uncharacterized protein n=1 Tax=Glossina austeni TaxID=7395 RepID=A0A1A9UHZ5_GLOAU